VDNDVSDFRQVSVHTDQKVRVEDAEIEKGAKILLCDAEYQKKDWGENLYVFDVKKESVNLKAIPYYCWANRKLGPMTVWINRI